MSEVLNAPIDLTNAKSILAQKKAEKKVARAAKRAEFENRNDPAVIAKAEEVIGQIKDKAEAAAAKGKSVFKVYDIPTEDIRDGFEEVYDFDSGRFFVKRSDLRNASALIFDYCNVNNLDPVPIDVKGRSNTYKIVVAIQ